MRKYLFVFVIIFSIVGGLIGYRVLGNYLYPTKYHDYVAEYAAKNQLPESLVFSVIRTESGFDPMAESEIGARGLMQITEETFQWIKLRMGDNETSYSDLYIAETNIKYGSFLLRMLLDEFGTINNAICAYHAGFGTATKWLSSEEYAPDGINITNIPYKDTRHHVYKVEDAIEKYEKILNED